MTVQSAAITMQPRYAEAIQRWQAFWALEEVERPLWIVPTSPVLTAALLRLAPMPELVKDARVQVDAQLGLLAWREATDLGDDFVPHVQPYAGVTVFASAFGCPVEFFEHTLPWAHPVIGPEDPPEKVYELAPPAVDAGQLGEMLALADLLVARTQGRYPVAMTDLQGPLDTAYLVWDSRSFMMAMHTNPHEVHHLMRLVTDLIIRYVREQRSRCAQFVPCHFPPLWLPDGQGIAISDDCLAVIGPDLYREFCLPYVNELSEEFGGVVIHSCGNFVHQFDVLAEIRDLRGINFGASETPFEAVWERFGGVTAVIPHLGLNNDDYFQDNQAYLEHVLRTRTHDRGLCIIVAPGAGDTGGMPKFAERVRETLARSRPS